MKVILTEGQLKDVVRNELMENAVLEDEAAQQVMNNVSTAQTTNDVYKILAAAIRNGWITMPTALLIVARVLGDSPALMQIKNLLVNAFSKNKQVVNQMQADAQQQAKAFTPATGVSDAALSQICIWETRHDFGYQMGQKDLYGYYNKGEGKKTYGYGLKTHPNGDFMENVKQVWSQPELEQLFKEKINIETQWVLNWAQKNGVKLGQGQLDAMVSAVYNYGRAGFLNTGIPSLIAENPNNPEIPEVWATASDYRKNMGGLHTRRRKEAEWYQSDMNA